MQNRFFFAAIQTILLGISHGQRLLDVYYLSSTLFWVSQAAAHISDAISTMRSNYECYNRLETGYSLYVAKALFEASVGSALNRGAEIIGAMPTCEPLQMEILFVF